MKTITLHRRAHDNNTMDPRIASVTLPMIPGVDVTTDRSETEPRGRVIRGEGDWRDSKTLAMASRIR
jgi:hypothetical protein